MHTSQNQVLTWTSPLTYLSAIIFSIGNLLLPMLLHAIPNGGVIWQPIFFFTLIATYRYGIRAGLLTAILSPILNHMFFGMPIATILPLIILKGCALAYFIHFAKLRCKRLNPMPLLLAVIASQLVGFCLLWAFFYPLVGCISYLAMSIPGILLQAIGGYFVLKFCLKVH